MSSEDSPFRVSFEPMLLSLAVCCSFAYQSSNAILICNPLSQFNFEQTCTSFSKRSQQNTHITPATRIASTIPASSHNMAATRRCVVPKALGIIHEIRKLPKKQPAYDMQSRATKRKSKKELCTDQ